MRDEDLLLTLRLIEEPKVQRIALAVNPLPQHGVRESALLQVPFRVDVGAHNCGDAVARERERGVVDVPHPRALRGVDGALVLLHAYFVRDARVGDEEELVGAGEGGVERRGVAVVAAADLDAGLFDQGSRAGGVVEGYDDVGCCDVCQ